jgi:hypothetical protein
MIFSFVENLAQRAQKTQSWLLDEFVNLQFPSLPVKCHYKTTYVQYVQKQNQHLKNTRNLSPPIIYYRQDIYFTFYYGVTRYIIYCRKLKY